MKEVEIELFKFDSKVDYLPYYKSYTLKYKDSETILELLNKINNIEVFAYKAVAEFNLKINGLYTDAGQFIKDVVTSNKLKIEPVSIYRALNDLVIDKKDYLQKITLFKEYLTPVEMDEYAKNLELDYFASNTYEIDRDYIGDHALLIAVDIIEQKPEYKDEIMKIISSFDDGIWYHTSLKNRVFNYNKDKENMINALLEMLPKATNTKVDLNKRVEKEDIKITQFFDGFNIAEFEGLNKESCEEIIKKSKANYIKLYSSQDDLAPHSRVVNKDFSRKIAGKILIEAKDSNADFLIVRGESDLSLFDGEQKKIEKIIGREIALPVITQGEFKMLLAGEKNTKALGFNKHKVKVLFL